MKIDGTYVRKNEKLLYEEVELLKRAAIEELKKRYKTRKNLLENDSNICDKENTIMTIKELLRISEKANASRRNYSTNDTPDFLTSIDVRDTVKAQQELEEKISSTKTTHLLEIFYRIRKSCVNMNRRHDPWYLEEDLDSITEEQIKYYEEKLAEEIRIDEEIEAEKAANETNKDKN